MAKFGGIFRKKKPEGKRPEEAHRTGQNSGRPQVFSYYTSQRQRETANYAQRPYRGEDTTILAREHPQNREELRDKRSGLQRFSTFLAVVLIGGSLFIASTLSAQPRVRVRMAGGKDQSVIYRTHAEYQSVAGKAVKASPLNRSKLWLQRQQIESIISQELPEVKSVRLATPMVNRDLVITIETEGPGLVIKGSSGNFVVDASGTVVNVLEDAPGVDGLPVIEDQTGTDLSIGKPAMAAHEIAFVSLLHKQLAAEDRPVTTYVFPANIGNELHVRFADHPYFVKFALNGDVRLQTGTYLATKADLDRQLVNPAEYLDVRVEGRAYYK